MTPAAPGPEPSIAPNGSTTAGADLRAAASTAMTAIIDGPVCSARVIGRSPAAAYLATEGSADLRGSIVALVDPRAVRLPCALVVPTLPARIRVGMTARIGAGEVSVAGTRVRVVRWWEPRPVLPPVQAGTLAQRLARLPPGSAAAGTPAASRLTAAGDALGRALSASDVGAATAAAARMIGAGPGLTPSGDDVVAGALAALRLLGNALARPSPRTAARVDAVSRIPQDGRVARGWLDDLGTAVETLARHRTTAVSAALLAHAGRGEVAVPAAGLLSALAGRGDVARAAAVLAEVGHTSGRDLIVGISLGTRAAVAGSGPETRPPATVREDTGRTNR